MSVRDCNGVSIEANTIVAYKLLTSADAAQPALAYQFCWVTGVGTEAAIMEPLYYRLVATGNFVRQQVFDSSRVQLVLGSALPVSLARLTHLFPELLCAVKEEEMRAVAEALRELTCEVGRV